MLSAIFTPVRPTSSPARSTAQAGLLVALCLVIRRQLTPQVPFLNLGGLPLLLSGLLLGARGGAAVGAVSDVLGFLISSPGPYHPFYTLTATLTAALPPLLLNRGRALDRVPTWIALLAAVSTTQVLTKVLLIPTLQAHLSATSWQPLAKLSAGVQVVHIPAYTVILRLLLEGLLPRTKHGGAATPAQDGQQPTWN